LSTTQHYADFAPQVALLLDNDADQHQQASDHLRLMFSTLLTPAAPQQ
jgi:TetR/AcrR family transcriptional regulator